METGFRANSLFSQSPQRIAIVRSLPGLGDLLCAVPALRALRTAFPNAHITLIGLPWAKTFVQRFQDYLDEWLEFPGYPGIPEVLLSPQKTVSFLAQAQKLAFDLVLQMHGNGSVMNGFAQLLNAKQTAGFFPGEQACPDPDRFLPYPEHEPEIWRHLRLIEFLGIPLQGEHLEFPIWQSDWQELENLVQTYSLKPNYICIHPGASVSERRWSIEHFAIVADTLAAKGYPIVLTGTANEQDLTQTVAQRMQYAAIDLAGKTTLGTMAALLKQARLLICNDTGVSHLAAALQTQSVVIFSNSDPFRWSPLDRQRHRVVVGQSYCNQAATSTTPAQVLQEAIDLLQQEVAYVS